MDVRQTDSYASYLKKIKWKIEQNPHTKNFYYIRKLPLTPFSVMKIQRPRASIDFSFLQSIIKKHRVIQSNIEPLDDGCVAIVSRKGYRRNKIPFLPSNTVLIDLSLPQKTLLALMKHKTRYNIGLSKRRGVSTRVFNGDELLASNGKLFEDLFSMQKQNAKRLGIFSLPKKWFYRQVSSFSKNCFAVMAYKDEELVAATYYLTSDNSVYYSHNGSTPEGRKCFAPTACAWGGVVEGKNRGLNLFDFEGIYDPRSKVVRWQGFTRFKKGFGGQETMYPGLYSKWHFFG